MYGRVLVLVPLSLLVALACTPAGTGQGLEQTARQVTIHRDAFGVAHVHGETDRATAFGFAYAQAEDNFWQIEENVIRATGRAAEIHGEPLVLDDWLNRALRIADLSREEYHAVDPAVRALLDGFAAGLNYYVQRHPEVEVRLLERFEPWHPLAFIRYLYYQRGFLGAAGIRSQVARAALEQSMGVVPSELDASLLDPAAREGLGSNSWAVTPQKSASGHALLFINPHLPFFGPSQVYEGHVMSDEGWNFTGYTRFGFPLPYVGFNEHLGWASTDNAADLSDAYRITFDDPSRPLAYRYGDGHRTATEWVEEITVQTDSGREIRPARFRATHHGPIVGIRDGVPLAVRMAKFEEPGWLDQWYAMTRARTLDEFVAAVSRLDMLFGNYLYADQDDNIFYAYNAAVPIRSEEFDWRQPVDGSTPATEWQGYHPMEEIPQLLNPATGWLQNCNGTPFLSTSAGNPDPDAFPSYMVREGDNARHRQARRILAAHDTFTFEGWAQAAYSTHMVDAEERVAQLASEWERLRRRDSGRAAALAELVEVLQSWDGVSTTESVATTLYVLSGEQRMEAERRGDPLEWALTQALEGAKEELERDWGTWRVAWGDVNRLQRVQSSGASGFGPETSSVAAAGAPSWAGAMFTLNGASPDGDPRRYGVHGNSYVAVVEFGPTVRARSLHTFGPSADPESPHFFGLAPRYAAGDFKPAWLHLDDVRENAVRSYRPGEERG
jgi:penicillin amidase